MEDIINRWTNSFTVFCLDDFSNKNNFETVLLSYETYLLGDFPSNIFPKDNEYKEKR